MPGQVIESRRWIHTSGRTASPYGSAPWTSEADRPNWSIEVQGYTIQHPDGTIGIGRKPFETRAEAQAWIDRNPNFRGMQQD